MKPVRALALVAGLLAPAEAGAGELEARFIGNMAFHISDGATSLLTDFPYESGYSGYMKWSEELVPQTDQHTLCLITHGHRDHFDRDRFAALPARVIGPQDVVRGFEARSLPMAARVEYRGIVIEPIATAHANREHYSYRVTWNGLRLYFTGDTDDAGPLLQETGLDVAFVSPWLLEAAQKRGVRIPAKRVAVYHHADHYAGPDYQGRTLPRQGERLLLRSAP